MRPLAQALNDHELIVLRVIGEWWDLDLNGADKATCLRTLTSALGQLDLSQEAKQLEEEEYEAFDGLVQAGGRMPVSAFARQFGDVRRMGPGKMEEEEPWYNPENVAESLWYRGFLYRAFNKTADGMIEFYYLPTEFQRQFAPKQDAPTERKSQKSSRLMEVPAYPPSSTPPIKKIQESSGLTAVQPPPNLSFNPAPITTADDLTTILAAAQNLPLTEENLPRLQKWLLDVHPTRQKLLLTLAWEMSFLRKTEEGIKPTKTGVAWMQKGRAEQLQLLAEAWSGCSWNELRHTPNLSCEGEWENDPLLARSAVLDAVPRTTEWYALSDLVASIKAQNSNFQRPDGKYNIWYIRDLVTNSYLSGFESWNSVEGRLITFLIWGPLHWLGLCDWAEELGLYRLTQRALDWLAGKKQTQLDTPTPISLIADGTLVVPASASRYQRFQIARIAELQPITSPDQSYLYRLTPSSLEQAKTQGITAPRLLEFLTQINERELPGGLKRAIERWATLGIEAYLEQPVILRVKQTEILEKLRTNPKTIPYLGETLGDLAIIVTDWQKLYQAAIQLGLILDPQNLSINNPA